MRIYSQSRHWSVREPEQASRSSPSCLTCAQKRKTLTRTSRSATAHFATTACMQPAAWLCSSCDCCKRPSSEPVTLWVVDLAVQRLRASDRLRGWPPVRVSPAGAGLSLAPVQIATDSYLFSLPYSFLLLPFVLRRRAVGIYSHAGNR